MVQFAGGMVCVVVDGWCYRVRMVVFWVVGIWVWEIVHRGAGELGG